MKSARVQAVLSGVFLLVVIGAYWWWLASVEAMSAHAASLASQIATDQNTSANISASKDELSTLSSEENEVASYFVTSAGVVSFLENLQSLGTAEGAQVQVVSVSAGGDASNPTLVVSLSLSGTFAQVLAAAGAIEYAPYDLTVSTLSLSGTGKNVWQASMNIQVGANTILPASATSKPTPSAAPAAPSGPGTKTAPL